jgi:hypothetical protein
VKCQRKDLGPKALPDKDQDSFLLQEDQDPADQAPDQGRGRAECQAADPPWAEELT